MISVSASGLITATAGDETATKQLSTQAAKTVTPGASSKTVVESGKYTTGAVTVAGDSNLAAENIKSGVNIFGVMGTLSGVELVEVTPSESDFTCNSDLSVTVQVAGISETSTVVNISLPLTIDGVSAGLISGPHRGYVTRAIFADNCTLVNSLEFMVGNGYITIPGVFRYIEYLVNTSALIVDSNHNILPVVSYYDA